MELKNIFITGAATGIGKATANAFYQQGWSVGLVDIDIDSLKSNTEGWDKKRVFCAQVDVTDYQQVQAALSDFCQRTSGRLRALHNNAGIMHLGNFEALSIEQHHATINVNVNGTINLLMAAFPYLRAAEDATVINMASASTLYGIPQFSSYAASKSAVQSLTESLQIEWENYGIRILDMMPPFVDTALVSQQSTKPAIIDRMGVDLGPEEVAQAVFNSIQSKRTHVPVSKRFSALYYACHALPSFIRKPAIRFLSRADRSELDPVQRGICKLISLGPAMHTFSMPVMRKNYLLLEKLFGLPKDESINTRDFHIPIPSTDKKTGSATNIPARIYKPSSSGDTPKATLVFFHGGGCIIGDIDTHDALCRQIAKNSNINVISVAYRLAPEVTFPTPICDAIDAVNWITSNQQELALGAGSEPHKIGVSGDSFGGYLAAMCSTPGLQHDLPTSITTQPDFQVLLYPIFDFRAISASVKEHGTGLIFSTHMLHRFRAALFNSASEISRTDVSILLNDEMANTVPTVLYSCEFDILRDDSFAYAKKLQENGITLQHQHLTDCSHAFIHAGRFSKRVKAHLNQLYADINAIIE
ncbi:SDR family oxidoreductase [Alteromonas sp. a30]|uniref:SDR family oxidoreductase n=1 Tax=Alteromonas sp. a30 TaxID=2730917 RepID=UPI00227E468E|nr:SDR family oxidoreductase [Alteromonas sp. a30]MCY7295587.1 SDR family oxidoreductase [Alteromonas sp. a30]